jgi:hypothetical protein
LATVIVPEKLTVTVSDEAVHGELEIFQTNLFRPGESPVTELEGELALPNVPVPEATVQLPVPVRGVFAARFVLFKHTTWSAPALAGVGEAIELTVTVSTDDVQPLLLIVQMNLLSPVDNPLTAVTGLDEEVMVPAPDTKDHMPVPLIGLLPFSVYVVPHSIVSLPAFAAVG